MLCINAEIWHKNTLKSINSIFNVESKKKTLFASNFSKKIEFKKKFSFKLLIYSFANDFLNFHFLMIITLFIYFSFKFYKKVEKWKFSWRTTQWTKCIMFLFISIINNSCHIVFKSSFALLHTIKLLKCKKSPARTKKFNWKLYAKKKFNCSLFLMTH